MSTDNSSTIVSKVWNYPPSPSVFAEASTDKRPRPTGRRTGWNDPPSLSELRRPNAYVLKNAGVGYPKAAGSICSPMKPS